MKSKAAWEPEYHRVFVDLCVEQRLLGNKPGTQHILEPFLEKSGARFNRKQLKNHWDTMGKQWKVWRRLVRCDAMKWDPETNTFGASDQDWANYLQRNPDAGQYRLSPPLYLEKLEIIFDGSNIDDEAGSGSKRKRRSRNNHNHPHHRHLEEEENDTGEEEDEDRQSASNFTTPQSKGYWSPSSHELFLDLLVQETLKGNRPDTHYPKESWKLIHETINQTTGKNYTRAQLKNHWDCTRKAWKIWCQVVGAGIMKWDPETGTFGATDEEWRIYLSENPRAAQFRRKQVPHADKLAVIFKGVIEPGRADFRAYRRRGLTEHDSESPQLHDPTPLSTLYTNEPVTGSEEGDEYDDDGDDEPSLHHGRRFRSVGFAESRLQDVEIVTPVCQRFNMEKLKEPLSVQMASGGGGGGGGKQSEYTIGDCIQCLDAMEEVEEGSDLYLFALDLFLRREYREIFLQLKKSSLRMSWLLRHQSGGGPSLAIAS